METLIAGTVIPMQRRDIPREERREALRRSLVEKWHAHARKLLTDAGVPEWVEVGGMPGNSLPHRLEWLIMRLKDVSAAERAGVCDELNDRWNSPAAGRGRST